MTERPIHSSRGPSSAHRWMKCAGSILLTEKLFRDISNFSDAAGGDAALGTCVHTMMAECLLTDREAWELIGQKISADGWDFVIDDEMAMSAQMHVNFVNELLEEYKADGIVPIVKVEEKLHSDLDPDAYGTADTIIYIPGWAIVIIDLKNGKMIVEPNDEQLSYYAALAYEKRPPEMKGDGEPKMIFQYIVQPRIPHPGGLIRKYETTPTDNYNWFMNKVIPAIIRTRDPDAKLTMGEHCRFCPNKEHCPALQTEITSFPVDAEPSTLTAEKIGELLDKAGVINTFLERLKTEAFKRVMAGEVIPGRKLVRMKSNRAWKDGAQTALVNELGSVVFTEPILKSPAQVEKLVGGKDLVPTWAYTPDKGLTLAPISDKRIEVQRPMDQFDVSELDF